MTAVTFPTGVLHTRSGADAVVFVRTFDVSAEQVWAMISRSELTARWFGTFDGDPAEGHVMVSMNAEGDDNTTPIRYSVDRCEPPRLLQVSSSTDVGDWDLELRVEPSGSGSTLALSHLVTDPASIDSIGPGWEYYLDRLAAAIAGTDPGAVDWADYFPAMQPYYRQIQEQLSAR